MRPCLLRPMPDGKAILMNHPEQDLQNGLQTFMKELLKDAGARRRRTGQTHPVRPH